MISARHRGAAVSLIAALAATSACQRAPVQGSPEPRASDSAPPSLRVEPARYDFGTFTQDDVASAKFALVNTGASRVELEARTDALDCHGSIAPSTIERGARAELSVECRPKYYGPLALSLPIRAATTGALVSELELRGKVTPLLAFDTPLVSLSMPFGAERSTVVHLEGALAARAKLSFKDDADAGFQIEVLPAEVGAAPALRLTASGKKVGTHVGNIVGTTEFAKPHEIRLPYSCEVTGNLRLTPSTPYFDLRAPGGDSQQILVSSSDPKFVLQSAEITEGPFEASFTRDGRPGGYRVTVVLRRERVHGDPRGILGQLVLHSNDHAEPAKEVSLFALGAANSARDPAR